MSKYFQISLSVSSANYYVNLSNMESATQLWAYGYITEQTGVNVMLWAYRYITERAGVNVML